MSAARSQTITFQSNELVSTNLEFRDQLCRVPASGSQVNTDATTHSGEKHALDVGDALDVSLKPSHDCTRLQVPYYCHPGAAPCCYISS